MSNQAPQTGEAAAAAPSESTSGTTPQNTPETTAEAAAGTKPDYSALRKAWSTLQRHPLGVVAALGAATAFAEVELAVGILAGMGATALLVSSNGAETREQALARGKRVLQRARALVSRPKASDEAATPPPAAAA